MLRNSIRMLINSIRMLINSIRSQGFTSPKFSAFDKNTSHQNNERIIRCDRLLARNASSSCTKRVSRPLQLLLKPISMHACIRSLHSLSTEHSSRLWTAHAHTPCRTPASGRSAEPRRASSRSPNSRKSAVILNARPQCTLGPCCPIRKPSLMGLPLALFLALKDV